MFTGKQLGRRLKVGVVHPGLGFGGSEAATLWTIEALKQEYDVTLISMKRVDLARLNAYYGTPLARGDFSIRQVPVPIGLRETVKFAALRGRFLLRYVRSIASAFDVLINMYGPADFGKPGIQRIADFSFVEEWRLELHPTIRTWKAWLYGDTVLRRGYLGLCDFIARLNPEAWKQNVTVANSAWSADRMLKKYGVSSKVLYAPVLSKFPSVPYSDRENGFVCLGRISPEKRVDTIIEILGRVRQKGHKVHLRILGGLDDSSYSRTVKKLADENKDWVFIEGWAVGLRKRELLARHRYGIHGRDNEPFGIAVAEMVLAGCIVFVPQGGGQVEIVNHPALIYENVEDAVNKIDAVLTSESEQEKLRRHLLEDCNSFSVSSFVESMREVVAEFVKQHVPVREQAAEKALPACSET